MIRAEADRLGAQVSFFQSNHEGALVDAIQQAYFDHVDGIVINPGSLHPHQCGPAGCREGGGDPHGGGPRLRLSGQPETWSSAVGIPTAFTASSRATLVWV